MDEIPQILLERSNGKELTRRGVAIDVVWENRAQGTIVTNMGRRNLN